MPDSLHHDRSCVATPKRADGLHIMSGMAASPLTLAALATVAVPGLRVRAAATHTHRERGWFHSARLFTDDGRDLLLRVPAEPEAEVEQSADLLALRALSAGSRASLSFAVPEYLGQTPFDDTRAVVTTFISGDRYSAADLTTGIALADSVGAAVAEIHNLPAGFILDAGLPQHTATETRAVLLETVGRAADTNLLPNAVLRRWEVALDNDALWRFRPTVIHGELSAEAILVLEDRVAGIVGWAQLAEGDPARDLHWLINAAGSDVDRTFEAYRTHRHGDTDPALLQRAQLHSELELARWLLFGVTHHNEDIVADAVALLDGLVDRVHQHPGDHLSLRATNDLPLPDVRDVVASLPPHLRSASIADQPHGGDLLTDALPPRDARGHEDRGRGGASQTDELPHADDFVELIPNQSEAIEVDLSDWPQAPEPSADHERPEDREYPRDREP